MGKSFTLDVHSTNEYDVIPEVAVVILSNADIARIKELMGVVGKYKLLLCEAFVSCVEWMERECVDEDGEPTYTEMSHIAYDSMKVYDDNIVFCGQHKHGGGEFETDPLTLDVIERAQDYTA